MVLGQDLASVIYAYLTNSDLIFTDLEAPNEFEFLPPDFNTSLFDLPKIEIKIRSCNGQVSFGYPKVELWNHLLFVLSASGRLPFGTTPVNIEKSDDVLFVKTKSNKYSMSFSEIQTFTNRHNGNEVYDWFDARSCGPHDLEYFKQEHNFVKEMFFYPSSRLGTPSSVKDVLVISHMDDKQLSDFSFSPTMVRLKAVHVMDSLGIRGKKNGRNPNYPRTGDTHLYLNIKLEHRKRQVKKIKTNNNEYNIVQDFLKKEKHYNANSYLWQLNKKLFEEDLLIK